MFFQRLEDLRIGAGKTQEESAKILNCRREVYRHHEKGLYEIPAWAEIGLAQHYGTGTDYIFGLTDIRAPYEAASRRGAGNKCPLTLRQKTNQLLLARRAQESP